MVTTLLPKPPLWWEQAACQEHPELSWFPDEDGPRTPEAAAMSAKARGVCQSCPVRVDCLEYGMEQRFGIWGGLGPSQRKRLRKQLRINPGMRIQ